MNIVRQDTDYALRIMVNLARRCRSGAVSARVLADQEDISYQFTCKILQQLHKARLVGSTMGPKGGFSLAKAPAEICTLEIIEAIQGPVSLNKCLLSTGSCPRQPYCVVSRKLAKLQEYLDAYLRHITLQQLAVPDTRKKTAVRRRNR